MRNTTVISFGLLAVLLAGCTTIPRRTGEELPPDWEMKPSPAPAAKAHTGRMVPSKRPLPETTWIPLDQWGRLHDAKSLQRLSETPPTYSLSVNGGVFVVQAGSRYAHWDGMEIRLGFAPQMIGGRVCLHRLDVLKNLDPLTSPFIGSSRAHPLVVIDPGHGGGNTGTRSVLDGRLEKEFTLDWALRLKPLLERRGWQVLLTRTNDVNMTLPERVAFAEQHKADLFVSLHFNATGSRGDASGLETYCLTPTGMPSNLTREYDDDVTQVYPNNAFDEQNLQYAVRLHRALLAINGNQDRGVCRARFLGVLRGQNRPAVLIEGGYLSNPTEARHIEDPAYRQKLAQAVAQALTESTPLTNQFSGAGSQSTTLAPTVAGANAGSVTP